MWGTRHNSRKSKSLKHRGKKETEDSKNAPVLPPLVTPFLRVSKVLLFACMPVKPYLNNNLVAFGL
jgi:hypothetical protein